MSTKIVEKPQSPETNHAVTGAYIYDAGVFDIIKGLERSLGENWRSPT